MMSVRIGRRHADRREEKRFTLGVSDTQSRYVARRSNGGLRPGWHPARCLRGTTGTPIPDGDAEPGPGEVGGHRGSHRSQPDESDPFHDDLQPSPATRRQGDASGSAA